VTLEAAPVPVLPLPDDGSSMTRVEEAIAEALRDVGPRLRRVRTARGLTLTEVAAATGISKSTLSRLEHGQRRPTLELLLPLARAFRVPLDDLVGAPEFGDPRIRLKPRPVHGRTVIPLTGRPGGIQAWKIVIPAAQSEPALRTHDGHEWLHVLSGRMRLVLDGRDRILGEGEVAEFDTRLPHWFGSDGQQSAEVLSIFSRPGERQPAVPAQPGQDRVPSTSTPADRSPS
jgi:transcriptional regulator with XRE-family HTH domain